MAEQNNELVMKNHEFRPTDPSLFSEMNVTSHDGKELKSEYADTVCRGCGKCFSRVHRIWSKTR